jgi:hypothetical protein
MAVKLRQIATVVPVIHQTKHLHRQQRWDFQRAMEFGYPLAGKCLLIVKQEPQADARIQRDLYHQSQQKMVWALRPREDGLAGTP